ncbi:MAG: SDR family NAD(P)-dependent oxidoreductase [Hyphomicrobiales bacterium]|nr:SDR family NAD(P)-dependent oxidoreductase [Hyphomicrobiales bacterium]
MNGETAPAVIGLRPVLVTGGAGFIGSNVSDRLAREGHHVLVLDSLARKGTELNANWLTETHPDRITLITSDIRDSTALRQAVAEAGAVFHFAAQVAVTTSFADPKNDFSVNLSGTLGLLEEVRRQQRPIPFVFASTNKVYGELSNIALHCEDDAYRPREAEIGAYGISESRPLEFHTPYGCSKGAADQYVLDYARSFDMPASVLRMSCIYGPRQMGNEDQGWVAHFLIQALKGEPISIFGDGRQVRDILYVEDAVEAYLKAWRRINSVRGKAFNLGGGCANAVSLRALIAFIEASLGRDVEKRFEAWRCGDQRYYVSDRRRIDRELALPAPTPWREGVAKLLDWLRSEHGMPTSAHRSAPERTEATG